MRGVSTGDPDGKWKAWAKWLRLFGVVLAGTWLLGHSEHDIAVLLILGMVIGLMCYRIRLTGQHLELLIDQHPVQLNLYTDISRRVWIEWKSRGPVVRSCIREPYQQGWLDHAITVDGKPVLLRIFVKPFGDGYLVSNAGRGFEMAVVRNTCAW